MLSFKITNLTMWARMDSIF